MIAIQNITKKYENTTLFEDFTYNMDYKSICGLIGFNGAGKTTLLKIIAGIFKPDKGEILIANKNVYENEKIKQRIFLVQDDPYFLSQSTIGSMASFYKGYFEGWNDNVFTRLINLFNLDVNSRLNGFSKGMQRQAALILGLSTMPEFLLLDEAFDGLDAAKRNLVKYILTQYIKERAANIVISSHNLNEVEGLCDSIILIKEGHQILTSSISQVKSRSNKYDIIFVDKVSTSIVNSLGKTVTISDYSEHSIHIIYKGNSKSLHDLLRPYGTYSVIPIPMTLEEIFLEENEVKKIDLQGLFQI